MKITNVSIDFNNAVNPTTVEKRVSFFLKIRIVIYGFISNLPVSVENMFIEYIMLRIFDDSVWYLEERENRIMSILHVEYTKKPLWSNKVHLKYFKNKYEISIKSHRFKNKTDFKHR